MRHGSNLGGDLDRIYCGDMVRSSKETGLRHGSKNIVQVRTWFESYLLLDEQLICLEMLRIFTLTFSGRVLGFTILCFQYKCKHVFLSSSSHLVNLSIEVVL